MTWKEVLEYLKYLTDIQLNQEAMLLPPQSDRTVPTHLEPIISLGTVEEMCHVDGEIITETRSSEDFKHHPEQVVMLYDIFPYDKDGNMFYEIIEGGFIGNVTGEIYEFPGENNE
jgi:hypothetical protein